MAKKPGSLISKVSISRNVVVAQSCQTFCDPMGLHLAPLSFTVSQSLLKFMSTELVMPSNHLILCCPLSFCFQSFPSGSFPVSPLFSLDGQKYWNFGFSISPSSEYSVLISLGLTGLISLQSKGISRVLSNITVQKHQLFGAQTSLWSNSHIHT